MMDTFPAQLISASAAMIAIDAAEAESASGHVLIATAVVDATGHLVAFRRMDGVVLIAAAIAQQKAVTAALTARPTKQFQDMINSGIHSMLAVDGLCAVAGGIPIFAENRLVGAIGCSGGSAEEDEAAALAGVKSIS